MDSLCRVCIKKAEKCTSLNSKIEDSSNLSFLGFLNKCTSLNARESDSLPQSLCSICANSMETFYQLMKLAEKSDIILREALKNLMAKGRYNGSGETSSEEITIRNAKIKEEPEVFNQGDLFLCQPNRNSTGPQFSRNLDIVKKEVGVSESLSIIDLKDAEINESENFESRLDHPKGNIKELDDMLSCVDGRLASIDFRHCVGPISLLKNKLSKNFLFKTRCIPSNVKKKTDEADSKEIIKQEISDPQNIVGLCGLIDNRIFCEETTVRNETVEVDSTGSPPYILDIVKEEPRVSESTSIIAVKGPEKNESGIFEAKFNHLDRSIEEPDEISSCVDRRLTSIDSEYTDSEDDLPISLLKRRLAENEDDTDSQRNSCEEITIRNETIGHECEICGKQFSSKRYLKVHREYHKGITHKCDQCGKEFTHRYSLRRHKKWHNNPTPIQCETCKICNKKFSRKSYLNLHMESHRIIQKCDQCGKEYKNSLTLRRHMEWHANPKPFKCENCGRLLSNKHNYNRHMIKCKARFTIKASSYKLETFETS